MTEQPLDLHKPEPLSRTVEIWTVFNRALIGLALSLLLMVAGAALARMSG